MNRWTSRNYAGERDLEQMQALLMEARRQTDDWRYWHVGELIWSYFMVACHLNPQEFIRLWHDTEGVLIGYAILGEDPSFDCGVRQDDAQRIAFLEQNGFRPGEYAEVNMLRSLAEPIPTATLPAGYQ